MLALDKVMESDCTDQSEKNSSAFDALEKSVYAALESYANVHRGTGHFSVVSTRLYERAREIVLEYMGRDPVRDTVLFCTPRRADELTAQLAPASYELLSSEAVGLPLGLRAVAVPKRALPRGIPYETGGGVVKLVSRKSVAWADAPDRYEAGTPPIMTVIAWARALQLARRFGSSAFAPSTYARTAQEILEQDALSGLRGEPLLHALKKTLIGRELRVPTEQGERTFANLDNSASKPTFAPVWQAVCETWRQPDMGAAGDRRGGQRGMRPLPRRAA